MYKKKHIKLFFIVLFFALFSSPSNAIPPPTEQPFKKVTQDGQYVFVMLGSQYKCRYEYPLSGLYKNDGSANPIWTINWYAYDPFVKISSDGIHLIYHHCGVGYFDDIAVSFHSNGKLIRSYAVTDFVSWFEFALFPGHGMEGSRWCSSSYLDDQTSTFKLSLRNGARYDFDISTGQIKSSLVFPRWLPVLIIPFLFAACVLLPLKTFTVCLLPAILYIILRYQFGLAILFFIGFLAFGKIISISKSIKQLKNKVEKKRTAIFILLLLIICVPLVIKVILESSVIPTSKQELSDKKVEYLRCLESEADRTKKIIIDVPKAKGYIEDDGWIIPDFEINDGYNYSDINDFILAVFEAYATGKQEYIDRLSIPGVKPKIYEAFKNVKQYSLNEIKEINVNEVRDQFETKLSEKLLHKSRFYVVETSAIIEPSYETKNVIFLIAEIGYRYFLVE